MTTEGERDRDLEVMMEMVLESLKRRLQLPIELRAKIDKVLGRVRRRRGAEIERRENPSLSGLLVLIRSFGTGYVVP
jgi:hypothetical protein